MIILIKLRTKVALQEPTAKVAFELAYAPKAKLALPFASCPCVLIFIQIRIKTPCAFASVMK